MMGKVEVEAAISALETSITTLDTWVLVFAALVAVGVVGEAALGVRHWMLDGRLRTLRHVESQLHENELAQLAKDTADANARAAEANQKAEQERLERLRLEAVVAPRSLSLDQQRSIANAWKAFAGRKVSLTTYALDAEGATLGKQIIACLREAGLNAEDRTASNMPLGGFALGVHVNGSDNELVSAIATALQSVGHLAVEQHGPSLRNASIASGDPSAGTDLTASILVGVKPIMTIR